MPHPPPHITGCCSCRPGQHICGPPHRPKLFIGLFALSLSLLAQTLTHVNPAKLYARECAALFSFQFV